MKTRADEKFTFYESLCMFTLSFLFFVFLEMLPALLKEVGPAAWITVLLGGVFAAIFLGIFMLLYRRYQEMDFLEICDMVYGKYVSKIIQVLLIAYIICFAASALNQGVETLKVYAYSDMSSLQVDLLIMTAVGIAGLYSVKGIAKTVSIFLPFITGVVLLILFLSRKQYDVNLLNPVLGTGFPKAVRFGVLMSSAFGNIMLFSLVGSSYTDKKEFAKSAGWGIAIATLLFVTTALCYCMAIPYSSANDIEVGIIGLAQSNYNGRFIQRLESIYIAVDVMSVLLLISVTFLMLKKVYCHLFGISGSHDRAVIVPLAVIIICITRTIASMRVLRQLLRSLVRHHSVFIMMGIVLLTLLVSILRGQGKKGRPFVKTAALLLIPCLAAGTLTGCANHREPDSEIFPIMMGYDKGEKEKYRITFKFMTEAGSSRDPGAKGGSESSSQGEPPEDVMVIETASFASGIHTLNSLLPRKISLLHIKVLIVSEELAREGLDEIVMSLMRYSQIKPTMALAICKDSAYDLIASESPTMTEPAQIDLELMMEISKSSGAYVVVHLSDFLYRYKSAYGESAATYTNLNLSESSAGEDKSPPEKIAGVPGSFESGYLAGGVPAQGNRKLELAGMAVFREDKMVGLLNTKECMALNFLGDKIRSTDVSFQDMLDPSAYVSLELRRVQPVKVYTRVDGEGRAHIQIKVMVNGLLGVIQNTQTDYSANPQQYEDLRQHCGELMTQLCQDLIQKLQEEYRSDVLQLGRYVARNFKTIDEWEAYGWRDRFPEAEIQVDFEIMM